MLLQAVQHIHSHSHEGSLVDLDNHDMVVVGWMSESVVKRFTVQQVSSG